MSLSWISRFLFALVTSRHYDFSVRSQTVKPNIVFILADDLGYYAPGYMNQEIYTPTLDNLAKIGVALTSHYTYQFCSPTRGSLLTGRYPYKLSATRSNYGDLDVVDGIDMRFDMLPKKLKQSGYISHHVGKWHLGFSDIRFTPINRGFETTNGYLTGAQDHFFQTVAVCPSKSAKNEAKSISDVWVNNVGDPTSKGVYNDMRFSKAATEIIRLHASAGAAAAGATASSGSKIDVGKIQAKTHDDDYFLDDDGSPKPQPVGGKSMRGESSEGAGVDVAGSVADDDLDASARVSGIGRLGVSLAVSHAGSQQQQQQQAAPLFLYLALSNPHGPLQAPKEYLRLYPRLTYKPQKLFYAMVSYMDKVVGEVVAALVKAGMWNNTLLIWASDNGSPYNYGSNWPLRGLKLSNWEGGTRTPALVAGGLLPSSMHGKSLDGMMHVSDWYATIMGLAGLPAVDYGGPTRSDGIDMWRWLSGRVTGSPRTSVVYEHNLYKGEPATGALRIGNYKLLIGKQQSASWYGGPSNNYFNSNASTPRPSTAIYACSVKQPCLFNLQADPTEHYDIASHSPQIVRRMLTSWAQLSAEFHPPLKATRVPLGHCNAAIANGGFLAPFTTIRQ